MSEIKFPVYVHILIAGAIIMCLYLGWNLGHSIINVIRLAVTR